MTTVLGILVISYAFIAFEAIVPGGILGIFGFIGLFIAAYFAYLDFGGWFAPALTFLGGGLGALFLLFLEFKWLANSPLGNKLFLGKVVSGTSNKIQTGKDLVGHTGVTSTDMHPEGLVKVDAAEYDAYSEDGFLCKGTHVQVTGIDSFRIRVRSNS